jgi:hypothetical protein
MSVSYAELTLGAAIEVVVRLPLDDMDLLLRLDRDLDNVVSPAEIEAARPAIAAYVLKHVRVSRPAPLAGEVVGVGSWEDSNRFPYLEARMAFVGGGPGALTVAMSVLTDLYPDHRTLARIDRGGGRVEEFVFQQGAEWTGQAGGSGAWAAARSFVLLGVEHIFTGYDHILFLFGLLLVKRGFRSLVGIVTSFTVAHSLTLAAATLGLVQPSPWTIEAAIALSVAYIGFENLFVTDPRHRWKITFVFGLVHGFGFANVLREMSLPRSGLAVSLFSFNAGVEIGQLVIVALMFPVLLALARTRHHGLVTRVASVCIIATGLVWFYQRIW